MQIWKPLRLVILVGTFGTLIAWLGFLNSRPKSSQSPEQIGLPDPVNFAPQWQLVTSEKALTNLPATGRRYQFTDSQSIVQAEVILIDQRTPIEGAKILKELLGIPPEALAQHSFQRFNAQTGYFLEFTDHDRAYLSACINPTGAATFTSSQHIHNRNLQDLHPRRIVTWVLGLNDLRDWRCLWVNLSVPLPEKELQNGIRNSQEDQLRTEAAWATLRDFWQPWYQWWSQWFS
jgi:cyanosortase A-associated protein